MKTDRKPKGTVIAALVHEVVKAERFETIADVAAAVKARCAKLRIRYDTEQVAEAIRFVEHTRPVLVAPTPRPAPKPVDVQPISRSEAARFLDEIRKRVGGGQVKTMPAARPREVDPRVAARHAFGADKHRALQFVQQAIIDQAQRCDDLENELEAAAIEPVGV